MNEFDLAESSILDHHEPSWTAQGYKVVRRPSPTTLPAFFDKYRPDAVLLGRTPNVVVEIVRKGQPELARRVRDLKALLAGHEDWRLEVLYTGEEPDQVPGVSTESLREAVAAVRRVASVDVRSGLLLLWATLEAITRRLEPDRARHPQSPGRVVELLAGAGHITPSEAEQLRRAVEWRNRLAHGDLGTSPSTEELLALASVMDNLVRAVERKAGTAEDRI